jgi:hypothetical protein
LQHSIPTTDLLALANRHYTGDRTVTNEQQALLEMPLWLVIVLALLGGLSGEMWRADKAGATGWSLLRRLALRSGACMVCGVSTVMLLYAGGLSIWAASAFGCLTAVGGADVAMRLYERWAIRRLGLRDSTQPDER